MSNNNQTSGGRSEKDLAPQGSVSRMPLSQAMREGAKLHPQTLRGFAVPKGGGATCAIGAAMEGIGLDPFNYVREAHRVINERYRALFNTSATCPACGMEKDVWRTIVDLNDTHNWTRERIADWVEPVEQAHAVGGVSDTQEG